MYAEARQAAPRECCGLLGGRGELIRSLYALRNVAANPLVAYEAAAEDLFAAQREMRGRGEQLLGIYHSHPRASTPEPSATDVKLAFYPSALYFIISLGGVSEALAAFHLFEAEGRWERVVYRVAE